MNASHRLTTALLAALFVLPTAAFAQEPGTDAAAQAAAAIEANTRADASAAALAERYAGLAGSAEAAAGLVGALHAGTDSASAMSYEEIDAALGMTEAVMAAGTAANLDAALDSVLDLRASGLAWAEVAQTLDLDPAVAVNAAQSIATGVAGSVNAGLDRADSVGHRAAARIDANTRVEAGAGVGVSAGQGTSAGARIDAGARGHVERPQPLRPVRGLLGGNR